MSIMQKLVFLCAGLVVASALFRVPLKKKRTAEQNSGATTLRKPINRGARAAGILLATVLFLAAAGLGGVALSRIYADPGELSGPVVAEFVRVSTAEDEGYDEDYTVCRVEYQSTLTDARLAIEYTYEEWEALPEGHTVTGYIYTAAGLDTDAVLRSPADAEMVAAQLRVELTDREGLRLNVALALLLVSVGALIMTCGWQFYSAYEKVWFLAILILAAVFGILFPEEDCNGVSGILIMALYLADTLLNIWCELLISKQSKWNFIVSVFVELAEIGICVLLRYRFATMATTLFFWLPIDMISFINWHRHPDRQTEELTEVRTLSGWQEALVLVGIGVWTFGLGYLLTYLNVGTDLFGGNEVLATVVIYLDACASAVGVANGLFILFRFREQWIAWITCAILEGVINVLSGQYVLLVLKAGYLTNSIYGYAKWTKYIKRAKRSNAEKKPKRAHA